MTHSVQSHTLAISSPVLPTYGLDKRPILAPARLTGTEALGELFDYTLELVAVARPELPTWSAVDLINLDGLIGHEFTVDIEIEGRGSYVPGQPGNTGMSNIGAGTREITGLVTTARFLGASDRMASFQLTLRPWLYRATQNQDSRIFQDMTVLEITDLVLAPYGYPVEKRLIGRYPKRDYQRQCFESDFHFLARLWQEWGLYFWFEHSDGRHRLVLCNSPGAHRQHGPAYQEIRYHAPDSAHIDEEHIHELTVVHSLTAGAVSLIDDDYTQPRADLGVKYEDPRDTAFADGEHYAWGDYAQPQAGATGLSGTPNLPRDEAHMLARVRMDALRCVGLRAKGKGNLRGLEVARTFHLTHYPQQSANREYMVVSATLDIHHTDEATVPAGSGPRYQCVTEFEIQPANAVFCSPQTLAKPTRGTEAAIVTGPENQEIWTDALGRVKVQFKWDRHGRHDENSSCWLRVASSWQGNRLGTQYVPRIGHEVQVSYINNDPDLPIVTSSTANAFNQPVWPLPDNHALSGINTREYGHTGQSSRLAFDDTQGEIQAQLASDYGTSQLSLGFLRRILGKKGRQDARGKGFELRTDLWGVIRAARGLLITSEARRDAQGHAKEMADTVARLTQARDIHEKLTGLAQHHGAQQGDAGHSAVTRAIKAQNDGIRGKPSDGDAFPELPEPHVLVASAAGIELTAADSTHIASQDNLALTTGGDVGLAAGKSFYANVLERFSLFVHTLGIMLIAASGKVRIEAQRDDMDLIANRDLSLMSRAESITLRAPKCIRLVVNNTVVEINEQGYTVHTDGQHLVRAASHQTDVPLAQPVKMTLTDIDEAKVAEHFVLTEAGSGWVLPNLRYRIELADGQILAGISNAQGETSLAMSDSIQIATVELLREDGTILSTHQPALTRDAHATFDSARSDTA